MLRVLSLDLGERKGGMEEIIVQGHEAAFLSHLLVGNLMHRTLCY